MKPGGIIYVIIALMGLFFLYKLADMFSPGSYGHAELYELNYPEKKVIDAINNLKNTDAELRVPKVTIKNDGQFDLKDGKERSTDYWYKVYFYDKKNNQILFTWTRPSGSNTTTFAFVSINSGLDLGHWKDVNNDFGFFENREIKKNFEETILEKLKKNLERGL
ncbi:MAG TPA: hypothetical protein VL443_09475 [Cyclobacteriaceae bacterium]|jgi:hypothetical protein|nr:hypothetical protein [Cyclobacteriaceae bacterium]